MLTILLFKKQRSKVSKIWSKSLKKMDLLDWLCNAGNLSNM
nr:Ycf35 protein [Pyropia sp. Myanmar_A]BED43472.1 Ycf35 protein [Pyropia sp. Myanmar_C]